MQRGTSRRIEATCWRTWCVSVLAAGSLWLSPVPAQSQAGYPNQAIKLMVPNPAGGLPDTVARIVAWPILLLARISRIPIRIITASTRAVLSLFGIRELGERTIVSEEEIKHIVREGSAQGVLAQTEVDLIHSVFGFHETPVKKVMVPRPKMFALDVATPPGEVERMIVESGFSRIPVYEDGADNIVGLVYVKDALKRVHEAFEVLEKRIGDPIKVVINP